MIQFNSVPSAGFACVGTWGHLISGLAAVTNFGAEGTRGHVNRPDELTSATRLQYRQLYYTRTDEQKERKEKL